MSEPPAILSSSLEQQLDAAYSRVLRATVLCSSIAAAAAGPMVNWRSSLGVALGALVGTMNLVWLHEGAEMIVRRMLAANEGRPMDGVGASVAEGASNIDPGSIDPSNPGNIDPGSIEAGPVSAGAGPAAETVPLEVSGGPSAIERKPFPAPQAALSPPQAAFPPEAGGGPSKLRVMLFFPLRYLAVIAAIYAILKGYPGLLVSFIVGLALPTLALMGEGFYEAIMLQQDRPRQP